MRPGTSNIKNMISGRERGSVDSKRRPSAATVPHDSDYLGLSAPSAAISSEEVGPGSHSLYFARRRDTVLTHQGALHPPAVPPTPGATLPVFTCRGKQTAQLTGTPPSKHPLAEALPAVLITRPRKQPMLGNQNRVTPSSLDRNGRQNARSGLFYFLSLPK